MWLLTITAHNYHSSLFVSEHFSPVCSCVCFLYRFLLVKEHLVEFNQLAMAKAQGCEDMLNRVMTKDNIGLGVLLETREECYGAICKNLLD